MLVLVVAVLALAIISGCTSDQSAREHRDLSDHAPINGLPLDEPTRDATQVVTITAASEDARIAEGRAWSREADGTWTVAGDPFVAHLAISGLTAHERESLTASPIGSFSLTEAFGRLPNPGTRMHYFQTTPRDWWISQPGPLYNTHQVCVTNCPFRTGSPNAQLFYVRPQYDLAIVIDYNRFPARPGAGSGFFLHVTSGRPTNGCISVAEEDMVALLRWLDPRQHPRILIGVGTQ